MNKQIEQLVTPAVESLQSETRLNLPEPDIQMGLSENTEGVQVEAPNVLSDGQSVVDEGSTQDVVESTPLDISKIGNAVDIARYDLTEEKLENLSQILHG